MLSELGRLVVDELPMDVVNVYPRDGAIYIEAMYLTEPDETVTINYNADQQWFGGDGSLIYSTPSCGEARMKTASGGGTLIVYQRVEINEKRADRPAPAAP